MYPVQPPGVGLLVGEAFDPLYTKPTDPTNHISRRGRSRLLLDQMKGCATAARVRGEIWFSLARESDLLEFRRGVQYKVN